VVSATQDIADWPALSPDGAWILYHETPKQPSSERRLMRISVNGGVPQFVMKIRSVQGIYRYSCARAPASLCAVEEVSQDEKHVTLTAFDHLRGRGKVLRTVEKDPSTNYDASRLSPDGSTLAMLGMGAAEARIRLLSLSSSADREITVKGWSSLTSLEWFPDGQGFYCGSSSPQSHAVLHVDLKGNALPLWQTKGAGGPIWVIPSPDGRYLALTEAVTSGNMWMLEGF
jgi:Tol biopolymer transport system component